MYKYLQTILYQECSWKIDARMKHEMDPTQKYWAQDQGIYVNVYYILLLKRFFQSTKINGSCTIE